MVRRRRIMTKTGKNTKSSEKKMKEKKKRATKQRKKSADGTKENE